MVRHRHRPKFDERFEFVAKRLLRFAERTYYAGETDEDGNLVVIDKSIVNPRRLRQLYEGRYIDVADFDPVAALPSAPASPVRPEELASLLPPAAEGYDVSRETEAAAANFTTHSQAELAELADGDDDAPPAAEPLPDGWREMHGARLKSLVTRLTGIKVATKPEAVAILEAYERGRAA